MPRRAVDRVLPALAVLVALLSCLAVSGVLTGLPWLVLLALCIQVPAAAGVAVLARAEGAAGTPTAALDAAASDVVLLDGDGRITYAGPGSQDLLGTEPRLLVGRRLDDFVHAEDGIEVRNRIDAMLVAPSGRLFRWQVRGLAGDGDRPLWLELTARTTVDGDRPGVLVMVRDAGAGEELDPISRDELTGLTTRAEFFRRASRATAVAGPANQAAILFCDLDGFDGVNGVYGRAAGDEVLRSVADRLRRALRPHELIGRIGGDEFGVLLPAPVGREEAEVVAARLQDAVATPITLRAGDAVAVPMHIVVAIVSEPTLHAETVVPESNRTASRVLSP